MKAIVHGFFAGFNDVFRRAEVGRPNSQIYYVSAGGFHGLGLGQNFKGRFCPKMGQAFC